MGVFLSTAMPTLFALSIFSELSGDMILVLKIFVLMTIISYITSHLGTSPLAIILIIGLSWFIIFDYFWFFGGIYILYTIITFGVSAIIIDFFFINQGASMPKDEQMEGGISHGIDFNARQQALNHSRQSMAQSMMKR